MSNLDVAASSTRLLYLRNHALAIIDPLSMLIFKSMTRSESEPIDPDGRLRVRAMNEDLSHHAAPSKVTWRRQSHFTGLPL